MGLSPWGCAGLGAALGKRGNGGSAAKGLGGTIFLIVPIFEHSRKMACSTTCVQIRNIAAALRAITERFMLGAVGLALRGTLPRRLKG